MMLQGAHRMNRYFFRLSLIDHQLRQYKSKTSKISDKNKDQKTLLYNDKSRSMIRTNINLISFDFLCVYLKAYYNFFIIIFKEMSSIKQSNGFNYRYQSYFGKANQKQIKFHHRYSLSNLLTHKIQNLNIEVSPANKKKNGGFYKNTSLVTLNKSPTLTLNSSYSLNQRSNNSQIRIIPIQTEKKIRKKSDQDRETMKRNLEYKVIQAEKALQEIKIAFNMRLQEKQQILNHRYAKQTLQKVC